MRFKPRKRREDKQFLEKSQQRRVAVTYSVHVKLNKSHHNIIQDVRFLPEALKRASY